VTDDRRLEVRLTKEFQGFTLDVAWTTGDELTVLFGYSGSGKSLTLRMIAGLVVPDSGRVILRGQVLQDSAAKEFVPPQQRRLGFVGQDLALFPHMSVFKNVTYGLKDLEKEQRRERAEEFLALFHIEDLAKRLPREISGGQRQRVALARALAARPGALLLDEPFSALDLPLKNELWALISEIRETMRIPIVVVTHDPIDARTIADRLIVYQAGRVLRSGIPKKVLDDPDAPELLTLAESGATFHDVSEWGSSLEPHPVTFG
jgi:molybdate transport system ATP-binding protein